MAILRFQNRHVSVMSTVVSVRVDFGVPLVLAASTSLSVFIAENCLVEVTELGMLCSELEASKSGCLIAYSNSCLDLFPCKYSKQKTRAHPGNQVSHYRFFHLKFIYRPCPISLTSLLHFISHSLALAL